MPFLRRQRAQAHAGSVVDAPDEPAEDLKIAPVQQEEAFSLEIAQPHDPIPGGTQSTSQSTSHKTFKVARNFDRLMSSRPGGVVAALKEDVKELGSFQSTDIIVNAAFGDRTLITVESDSKEDPYYQSSWNERLGTQAAAKDPYGLGGWGEPVTLTAYTLTIKDAAAPLADGILTPLLRREEKVPTDKIWEFYSVRAIVRHKWDLWASQCLFRESMFFMGWLISFVCFLLVYIERDITEDYHRMNAEERGAAFMAYIADILSLCFMIPFLVKEFNALVLYYKWIRFRMWSIINFSCYTLQLLISAFHFSHFFFNGRVYTSLLAVHCVVLFVRVQYYIRVIEVGTAYVESLKTLIIAVRGLLLFIVLTVISAALAFATLYKWDNHESNTDLETFSSIPRSIITTFSVLLGNFDPAYVFHTENRPLKGIFFVVFQAVVSIAVLNLLIAVMTETYSRILERGVALHNRCRAQTIDLLEITIPRIFHETYKPYIHFLVREDKAQNEYHSRKRGLDGKGEPPRESAAQLEDLKTIIKAIDKKVDHLTSRMNEFSVSNPSHVENKSEA